MADYEFDNDDLLRVRGLILSLVGISEDLLENGLPRPPSVSMRTEAGRDAWSSYQESMEVMWYSITEAVEFLRESEDWRIVPCMAATHKDKGGE